MKAFSELPSLKDRDRFSAWLYRIAHNVCYSRFRKESGRTFVPLEIDPRHETGVDSEPVWLWRKRSPGCQTISARSSS